MGSDQNWNWAWATVGTAIRKHGAALSPEQIAALIEQGIEHGVQLAIDSFELEGNECIHRTPIGAAQRLRHVFYGEPEFGFPRCDDNQ